MPWKSTNALWRALLLLTGVATPLSAAQAHCDAINGPVVQAAERALQTADFSEIAIWVSDEHEEELRQKFEQSRNVYQQGGDPRELAQDYFYSTAVRLHRLSEGMTFEGVKPPQPLTQDLALAEQSLASENPGAVIDYLSRQMGEEVRELHRNVIEAAKSKEQSVEAGREWADAYVRYVIYVHGLDGTIEAGPAHGVGE